MNEKYSYKDFMDKSFTDRPASEFDNSEIVGSCFYQQGHPELKKIFPAGMTGVIFRRCNLDNVFVPLTCTVESNCSHRRIKAQNDKEDWIVDSDLKPIEPACKNLFIEKGMSIDPKDIPAEKITGAPTTTMEVI